MKNILSLNKIGEIFNRNHVLQHTPPSHYEVETYRQAIHKSDEKEYFLRYGSVLGKLDQNGS